MIITTDSVATVLQGETYLKVLPCNKSDKKKLICGFIFFKCISLLQGMYQARLIPGKYIMSMKVPTKK